MRYINKTRWVASIISNKTSNVPQEDQNEVEIIIGIQPKTRITIKMISYERKKECTEYVLIRALGPNYCFLIRPPLPGFYKFQVGAVLTLRKIAI